MEPSNVEEKQTRTEKVAGNIMESSNAEETETSTEKNASTGTATLPSNAEETTVPKLDACVICAARKV